MPRDTTGQYTLPLPPVFPGDVIESDWANTTLNDIAIALTDSLSRTGAGGLLVPFQVADGTVGAPGLAFGNEPTSGLYRSAINTWGLVVAGVERIRLQGSAVSVLAPTLRIQDGTVAAPGLSFASEPNSGLYRSAAKTWGLAVDGSERLRLDPDAMSVWGTPLRGIDGTLAAPTFSFINDSDSGLYRNGDNSLCLAVGGNQRLVVAVDYLRAFRPVLFDDGAPVLPALTFASEQNLGIYRPGVAALSVACEGVERFRVQRAVTSVYGASIRLVNNDAPPANRYFDINSGAGGFLLGALDETEAVFREYVSFAGGEHVVRAVGSGGFRVGQFGGGADLFGVSPGTVDIAFPPGGVDQKNFRIGYVNGNWYVGMLDDPRNSFKTCLVFSNNGGSQVLQAYSANGFIVNTGVASIFAAQADYVEINRNLRMPNVTAIQFRTSTGLDWNFAYATLTNNLVVGSYWQNLHLYSQGFERIRICQFGAVKMTNANRFFSEGTNWHEVCTDVPSYSCMFVNFNASSPYGIQSFYASWPPGARTGDNFHFLAQDSAGSVFYIASNGGVGNYQANNVNLCDTNAKRMVGDSPDYTDQVERLAFRRFTYKDAPDDDVVDDVTAQDVEQFAPDLVTTFGDTGLKGVYTHRLQNRINSVVPKLIVRMKQMAARIKALEDRG